MGGEAGEGGSGGAVAGGGMGGEMPGGGGMGGMPMEPTGPTATVTVLSDDQTTVLSAATGAIRGTNVWFTNFQLGTLFNDDDPVLPFTLGSVPLAGGDTGATIDLPGDDFYPEGVTAADDGTLYVGSATTGAVFMVPAGDADAGAAPEAVEFIAAGAVAERGVIGLTVDETRELLWFCDSNPTDQTGGALVGVQLADGVEVVRHNLQTIPPTDPSAADAGAPAADAGAAPVSPFCNDVIVDADGRLLISESLGGLIYEVPADAALTNDSAVVWSSAPEIGNPGGFGVNGLDMVGDMLIVANNGTLVAIDPATPNENLEVLVLSDEDGTAVSLCGPDGLATVPGSDDEFIVVENGGGGCDPAVSRIIKVTLDAD